MLSHLSENEHEKASNSEAANCHADAELTDEDCQAYGPMTEDSLPPRNANGKKSQSIRGHFVTGGCFLFFFFFFFVISCIHQSEYPKRISQVFYKLPACQ